MAKIEQKAGKPHLSYPAVVNRTITCIIRGYAPRKIWIFGSFARGDFHQGSDLDLLILKETPEKFPDRIEEVLQYIPGGIAVEPLVYTQREMEAMLAEKNTFLELALSEGVLVYEQQP
ncbi:MAG: nucleotidyltransferase domain-containing protein [Dehalococcoidales bacterium]|nr:nucleotidyltransferase domain-containing protein [Dehalococcoidales bacterium]